MKPLYVKKDGTVQKVSGIGMPATYPASSTSYDNTDSGLTATYVQDAIDELAAGGGVSVAANTTYDNTTSGLTADDVQDAIDELSSEKVDASLIGANNGIAELDQNGKVPSSQLPSYVDDVIEVEDYAHLPNTGESGKIYVTLDDNLTYRWSGTGYTEISASLALGETSSTAYRGDRGKTAYNHATDSSRLTTATASGLYKVAGTAEGHIASLTAVQKSDITALGIPESDTNTHRPIQVNGTQILGDNTTALNLKAGSNVSLTNNSGTVTIAATDTTYSDATTSTAGLMSVTDKTKLNGIATGAEVNQNAFSNVKVGESTIAADAKTDILELVAGSNVTLTPDTTNDKITIAATDTKYTAATAAPGDIASAGSAGTSTNYARQDHTHKITVATGDANGQVKIAGQNADVKGLGSAAYKNVPSSGNASSTEVVMGNDSRLSDSRTPASHTHGNIQNGGTLQTSDITIANGDKLVVTDASDSSKVARTSISFDGSTTTKALTQKGTFETFVQANSPAFTGTPTAPTATSGTNTTQIATTAFVQTAIDNLPEPMVFKGSLGTGGTITALPVNGTATIGDTYKVITAGTYASKSAKVGDTFICLTKTSSANTWELIPSGDEPSGTVTSVGITNGGGLSISGSPITSSGTITISHADTSSQASVDNSGRTYIQDITLDTYGHVTGIASATETVTNTDRYVNSASFAHDSTNDNIKMTLTRAGSDTATVVGNIPKVSSSTAGVAPKGAAVSSQSQTTKFLREDGSWAVPSYTSNTDTKVSQTATNTNTDYEVLFSETADNTTRTEGARKNSNLKFNPSTGNLKATKINGVALGDSPKFTDTTYTFTGGTNKFSYTPSGTIISIDIPITPSIENNITGSGTSGYIAKFNGANTVTNGPQIGSDTTKYLRNDGTWQVPPDTKYNDATTSIHGLMSASDKEKVNMIDTSTTSVSGNPIIITNSKSAQVAIDPIITFNPIQAGSGNPTPSNIRTINGYHRVNITSCGKNLLKGDKWATNSQNIFLGATEENDVIHTLFPGTYTLTVNTTKAGSTIYYSVNNGSSTQISSPFTFTVSTNAQYKFWVANSNGITINDITSFQLELGSQSTVYEPYISAASISDLIPETVYSGSLDVKTGNFTVNKVSIDLGSLTFTKDTSYSQNVFYAYSTSIPIPKNDSASTVANIISEIYTAASVHNVDHASANNTIGIMQYNTGARVWICDSRYTSRTDLQTALSGVKAIYEINNPYVIKVMPHDLPILSQYAYISTSGTSMSFKYYNGEMARLAIVSQLGQSLNILGSILDRFVTITGNLSGTVNTEVVISFPEGIKTSNFIYLGNVVLHSSGAWYSNVSDVKVITTSNIGIRVSTSKNQFLGQPIKIFGIVLF